MSRRKQSNPRQIKRSPGQMEEGEENLAEDNSLSGTEGGASDQEESAECDTSSPPFSEDPDPEKKETPEPPEKSEDKEMDSSEEVQPWNGPGPAIDAKPHTGNQS
ncbi:zinc finger protein ZFPM1-like [Latimeria chalumnae]|uniref:zinc finger protein ZFPM1-like n=1 Tax=Latimeria chalumnae TaxID=7897 RepID=UPI00313D3F1B